jgi:hypothetical protein
VRSGEVISSRVPYDQGSQGPIRRQLSIVLDLLKQVSLPSRVTTKLLRVTSEPMECDLWLAHDCIDEPRKFSKFVL